MKANKWVVVAVVVLAIVSPLRAELVYQPAKEDGPQEWMKAGALLLKTTAHISDAGSLFEEGNIEEATRKVRAASGLVAEARGAYRNLLPLEAEMAKPISIQEARIGTYRSFDVVPPKVRKDVVTIVERELDNLAMSMKTTLGVFNKQNMRALLFTSARLQILGLHIASDMQPAAK